MSVQVEKNKAVVVWGSSISAVVMVSKLASETLEYCKDLSF